MVEIEQDDDACGEHLVNEIEIAASDAPAAAAARVSSPHTTPRGHTLKLIKELHLEGTTDDVQDKISHT